jgi:hypothetical protein
MTGPMRRFTPPAASPAIDKYQSAIVAVKSSKSSENRVSPDIEFHALSGLFAVPVQGPEVVGARLDRVRNPDPERTGGQRRRNRDDRFGQWLATGLVDQHDLCPDHQISVGRRNYVVFKFNKINDCAHTKTVRNSPDGVNYKLHSELPLSFHPAREGLRSPVTALSAARLIKDA